MSGLEIAGLVLGAFPAAIDGLERYREVAKRMRFWRNIAAEHKKCESILKVQRGLFFLNLKKLLLPIVAIDDAAIEELLRDPGGEGWRADATTQLLSERLGASYEPYIQCMEDMKSTVCEINHALALDSTHIHKRDEYSENSKARKKVSKLKTKVEWELYRIRFSNGESEREQYFRELQQCNDRLQTLLQTSEDDVRLLRDRDSAKTINPAICNFWRQATKLFKALLAVWDCGFHTQHSTKLLLEHRANFDTDFKALFQHTKIRISSRELSRGSPVLVEGLTKSIPEKTMAIFEPHYRYFKHAKSAFRSKSASTSAELLRVPRSITLTAVEESSELGLKLKPIANLCVSLHESDGGDKYCGFLTEGDCKYYIYKEPELPQESHDFITLDQILRRQGLPMPKRRQRYTLAFVLASSFLQLLESPWLPVSWQKSDIVFCKHSGQPRAFRLDQPHINHETKSSAECGPDTENERRMQLAKSLERLGIVLLELCFGELLEERPCRKRFTNVDDDTHKSVFDVEAAKEWSLDVEEEAGYDYATAVGWCFTGILMTPSDRWRMEMLRKVVRPWKAASGTYLRVAENSHFSRKSLTRTS
ncbi:hypothetical protein F4778DRAFT_571904 [Xylariomycetidae sp. FL2044]|nr:hypothetical protein F4778DRAFT_571904 [Xylariomycetidae sp. FL2044]